VTLAEGLHHVGAVQVAIDGPVASGKSTVAKRLARQLGYTFLDTGALYRATAYLAHRARVDAGDESAVAGLITERSPSVVLDSQDPLSYRILADGELLGGELFSGEVATTVSRIAAMPSVRTKLLAAQRRFADGRNIVMAGRDIGTVVLPEATCKFFLTASIDTRVDRRLRQLEARGIEIDRATLKKDIESRDRRDSSRAVSPLLKASDALEVDTSDMSVDQVVTMLERVVRERMSP